MAKFNVGVKVTQLVPTLSNAQDRAKNPSGEKQYTVIGRSKKDARAKALAQHAAEVPIGAPQDFSVVAVATKQ